MTPTHSNRGNKTMTTLDQTNLQLTTVLLQRLSMIQKALTVLEETTISICTINSVDGMDTIQRLLDPVLDEVVDSAVSNAAIEQLRGAALDTLAELSSMGVSLSDDITVPLVEDRL